MGKFYWHVSYTVAFNNWSKYIIFVDEAVMMMTDSDDFIQGEYPLTSSMYLYTNPSVMSLEYMIVGDDTVGRRNHIVLIQTGRILLQNV